MKCVSFDGDADRQIYFYGEDKFGLIDGDKQFALIMMYLRDLMAKAEVIDKISHILV
jgi:phosphomannomutase